MKVIYDVLNNREDNYVLPFYWQQGDHTESIPDKMEEIYRGGCRAVCVESRPHKDFAGEGWWRDMDVIIAEAKKRDMKVWILDDDHFPTGHANGLINSKYPHLLPHYLVECHADIIGPMNDAALLYKKLNPEDELLSVGAFKHTADGKGFESGFIELTDKATDDTLYWDVPEGAYRVFFVFVTTMKAPNYIDMLSAESCRVMLESCYEPHYEHYAEHFGNTIEGFFSDEPKFNNSMFDFNRGFRSVYDTSVGDPGLLLPYHAELISIMEETLGYSPLGGLGALWYETASSPELRLAYMDAATKLYSRNFTQMLGNWCREHGVKYIGHIIEDKNCSTRMGYSVGHFFRGLTGQDWSGMDIVLHQIIPGFAHNRCTGTFSGAEGDPDFFHYTLAKMCASLSHIDPIMQNRAMCEVFGAYGWAEGTRTMKWLMDHLLIRGINRFIPHAYTTKFPYRDCPPHFGCNGHDPQYEGFAKLMRYTSKVAHIFENSVHKANAAVLYHAEAEWMSRSDYKTADTITVPLTDAHIDFDIIPCDTLYASPIEDGKLHINNEYYDCIIIPYAKNYPTQLISHLNAIAKMGFTVIYADRTPKTALNCISMDPAKLPESLRGRGFYDISVENDSGYLRYYHTSKEGCELFMFSNESLTETTDATIILPENTPANYTLLNLIMDEVSVGTVESNRLHITLEPYCSAIYIFGETVESAAPEYKWTTAAEIDTEYAISTASYENLDEFKSYKTSKLINILARNELPGFGGKVRYTAEINIPEELVGKKLRMNLGHVCECAELKLNGTDCGIRICPPYAFDITDAVKPGINELEFTAATTLAMVPEMKEADHLSPKLIIPPAGVLGPVTLEVGE